MNSISLYRHQLSGRLLVDAHPAGCFELVRISETRLLPGPNECKKLRTDRMVIRLFNRAAKFRITPADRSELANEANWERLEGMNALGAVFGKPDTAARAAAFKAKAISRITEVVSLGQKIVTVLEQFQKLTRSNPQGGG